MKKLNSIFGITLEFENEDLTSTGIHKHGFKLHVGKKSIGMSYNFLFEFTGNPCEKIVSTVLDENQSFKQTRVFSSNDISKTLTWFIDEYTLVVVSVESIVIHLTSLVSDGVVWPCVILTNYASNPDIEIVCQQGNPEIMNLN